MPDVSWARRKKGGGSRGRRKGGPAGRRACNGGGGGWTLHKKLIVACVRILNAKDGTVQSTQRKFGTMRRESRDRAEGWRSSKSPT